MNGNNLRLPAAGHNPRSTGYASRPPTHDRPTVLRHTATGTTGKPIFPPKATDNRPIVSQASRKLPETPPRQIVRQPGPSIPSGKSRPFYPPESLRATSFFSLFLMRSVISRTGTNDGLEFSGNPDHLDRNGDGHTIPANTDRLYTSHSTGTDTPHPLQGTSCLSAAREVDSLSISIPSPATPRHLPSYNRYAAHPGTGRLQRPSPETFSPLRQCPLTESGSTINRVPAFGRFPRNAYFSCDIRAKC